MLVSILAILALVLVISYWLYREAIYGRLSTRWQRQAANLAIYEERTTKTTDALDDEQNDVADEAKLLLVADSEGEKSDKKSEISRKFIGVASVAFVGGLSIFGYLYWGDPFAASLDSVAQQLQIATEMEAGPKKIQELNSIIQLLEQRNRSRHRDVASATYLTHVYFHKGDYESVIATHRQADERGLTSLSSDVQRIRAEFVMNEGSVNEEIEKVAKRIEEVEPGNPVVMQIYGLNSWRLNNFPQARVYFERALQHDADILSTNTAILEELIQRTNARLPADHIAVVVNVSVESLQATNYWLIVYAQGTNVLQPIATVKRPFAREEQYTLVLDDSVSTTPSRPLSEEQDVQIVARLSRSSSLAREDVIAEVRSGWVQPREDPNISLTIDPQNLISVTIVLAEHISVQDDDVIYIIGESNDETRAPILVKKLNVLKFPVAYAVRADDFIVSTTEIPEEGVRLLARLSSSGNLSTATGAHESDLVLAKVGDSVRLVIDRVVSHASGDEKPE